jgi:hypothetical protein
MKAPELRRAPARLCLLSRHPLTVAVDPIIGIGNHPVIGAESAVDQVAATSHGVDGVVVASGQLVYAGTADQGVGPSPP